jgi:hypothetical protein
MHLPAMRPPASARLTLHSPDPALAWPCACLPATHPLGYNADEESDDEAEPTVEKLEAMTRLFLPKKTEEYLEVVSTVLCCSQALC